ncbi:MAG: alpha/beta hydrolase [Alphaproteobacteria bacterium]|nr:alpha/beta hydrolase [Alphaproteobacteria bacterium]
MSSPDLVFIHGMFMTPKCWEGWMARAQARGLSCEAPAWPEHEASVAEQKARHPYPPLGALTLDAVLASYRERLSKLDRPPAIVGHSMGGLVVQLLLQEGLARCAVAVHPAPPKGVVALSWSFLKSNWGVINPFAKADEAWLPTLDQFAYGFSNGLPEDLQAQAYAELFVPESRQVGHGPTTDVAEIDFSKPHAPLWIIAGGADNMVPAAINEKNHQRYVKGGQPCEFEVMPQRTHMTLAQPGWEAVADRVLDWIQAH